MIAKLKAARESFTIKNDALNAILAKGAAASAEEITSGVALDEELTNLQSEIVMLQGVGDITGRAAERNLLLNAPVATIKQSGSPDPLMITGVTLKETVIPASVRKYKVTSFKDDVFTGVSKEVKAYRFGQWFLAALTGNEKARLFCKDHGIAIKAHTEGVNVGGGYLVPEEFENDLIDLRETYGLFRQWAKNTGMKSDTKSVPRRTGGLTAYFAGETKAVAESKKGWDRVQLTARKLMVLAKYSSELDEDSMIEIGNDLAGEIAYAFAHLEDQSGFLGDGTSAYGGIVGLHDKMIVATASIVPASGASWALTTLGDFDLVVGLLPQFADTPNTAWYCHKTYYHGVMERLMLAAGGVTAAEIAAGRRILQFMGYPVRISQVLPNASASGQIPVYFGDLAMAARFGDRRQTTIAMSEHVNFEEDEIAIRGTERFDVNVHDVGDTVNPGPMVALKTL